MTKNVAILGASDKPDRYAFKAFKLLQEYKHKVFLVNPQLEKVEQVDVFKSLSELTTKNIDTLTVYLNPQRLSSYVDQILLLKPKRVIFNPGTESTEIENNLSTAGIETLEACTLVMLKTNQF